jgi:hypothetical protein
MAGVLAGYGAFAVLISIVAAFANGAHSHQVLSGATWKQLGTGGGIVAGIVLFLAWAAGGFVAARMAGHDGLRHGIWVFVVGVVFITVVGAAITWLPDTTDILRNLRLLGLPLRRNEWRDVGTVGAVASLVGMAAGAATGGWFALREAAPAQARPRPAAVVPTAAPPSPAPAPAAPAASAAFAPSEPEPAFVRPSLFEDTGFEPEPLPDEEPATPPAPVASTEAPPPAPTPRPAPIVEQKPAWLQFIQERERANQERDQASPIDAPASPGPAPWAGDEPAPAFLDDPEPEPEPAQPTSWWPEQAEEGERAGEPARVYDEAWALPDDESAPGGGDEADRAFPSSHSTPVEEPDTETVAVPPPDVDPEEQAARRRQQEEAARAYEQMREDQ